MKASLTLLGAGIGGISGYPLSYFFQPEALQRKMTMGDYINKISNVMEDEGLRSTAVGTWITTIIAFAVIGFIIASLISQVAKQPQ